MTPHTDAPNPSEPSELAEPVGVSEPVVAGPGRRAPLSKIKTIFAMATLSCMLLVALGATVVGYLDDLNAKAQLQQTALAEASKKVFVEEMRKALDDQRRQFVNDIEILVPPTNDKLFTILSKAVTVTEDAINPNSVGATPEAAYTTDLTAIQQTDAWSQLVTIINTDTADNLCYKGIAWSSGGGATCQLKCAAAAITCTYAATDGMPLFPLQGVTRRYDGTNCICVVGSVANVAYTSERVLRRRPNLRHRRKLGRRQSQRKAA